MFVFFVAKSFPFIKLIRYLPVILYIIFSTGNCFPDDRGTNNQEPIVAVVYPSLNFMFEDTTRGMQESAKIKNIKLIVKAPEKGTHLEQQRILETLISMKVDVIAVCPINPELLTPIINKAVRRNIEVLCFAVDAPKSLRSLFIGEYSYESGRKLGQLAAHEINYSGDILIDLKMPLPSINSQRLNGLMDSLNEFTSIRTHIIKDSFRDEKAAVLLLEKAIQEHPEFKALITDSYSAKTAILIWKAGSINRPLFSFDMTSAIIQGIQDKKITSVVSINPYFYGKIIIENSDALMRSGNTLTNGNLKPILFDSINIDSYVDDHMKSLPTKSLW